LAMRWSFLIIERFIIRFRNHECSPEDFIGDFRPRRKSEIKGLRRQLRIQMNGSRVNFKPYMRANPTKVIRILVLDLLKGSGHGKPHAI